MAIILYMVLEGLQNHQLGTIFVMLFHLLLK